MHIHDSRFLGKLLVNGVEHVDETGLLEIAEVIDHRGAGSLDGLGQKRHIGRTGSLLSE